MSDEPFSLDQLYRAVEQHLRTYLPGVQAVTAWPGIKDRLLLPAVFLEVAEIEPGTEIGTGETSLVCKFEARIIVDPIKPHHHQQAVQLATQLAVLLRAQTWGLAVEPAEFVQSLQDFTQPHLDGYTVWLVEWTQQVYLGPEEWLWPDEPPGMLLIGFQDDVKEDFVPSGGDVSSYASAQHDRMIAGAVKACYVVAVDLSASPPVCRVSDGSEWVSAWVRWHSIAAGKARHWRAPSLGEQGSLISPSGDVSQGTFVPGLYGNAGPPPDNRDHVEVWRFDDGGSLIYDWQAKSYSITLPSGTVTIKVASTEAVVTDSAVNVTTGNINLKAAVMIDGALHVTKGITSAGAIIDATGNSNHHTH